MLWHFCVFIITCFFIGWITNKIAIWLLFRPYEKKIWLPFISPGIFPKNKNEFAEEISNVVEKKLLMEGGFVSNVKRETGLGILDIMYPGFTDNMIKGLPIKNTIKNNIEKLENEEIEKLVRLVCDKYFFHIEIFGGLLGALIGVLQVFMVRFLF